MLVCEAVRRGAEAVQVQVDEALEDALQVRARCMYGLLRGGRAHVDELTLRKSD
jgi:hypothetical protein